MKGLKTGGGSRKGRPNKATAAKAAAIAASGLTPLDYMLSVLRNEDNDASIRLDAAKAAAPYVHPKLAQVEMSGPQGGPVEVKLSTNDRARRVAFLLAKAMREKA